MNSLPVKWWLLSKSVMLDFSSFRFPVSFGMKPISGLMDSMHGPDRLCQEPSSLFSFPSSYIIYGVPKNIILLS